MDTATREQAWNTEQLAHPVTRPSWRVWTYHAPALVLGCSQRALHEGVVQRTASSLPCLTREAGGGAVLTGPWLVSVSVALPPQHPWVSSGLIDSYRMLGQLHQAALQQLGVAAHALTPQELPLAQQTHSAGAPKWACFGGLSHWEVVNTEGRKLVGLAQRRRRQGVLLVAGTLVGRPDWRLLCEAMACPQDEPFLQRSTVSVEEILGSPGEPEPFAALLHTLLEHAL